MKKRLLSILLCLTMVTGLLPTAFAAEKDTETEFPYTYNTKNDIQKTIRPPRRFPIRR